MAIFAHLSGLAGYLIPLGGAIVPVLLMILHGNPLIRALAKQAFFLNLVILILGIAAYILILTIILIPGYIVVYAVLAAVAFILPIYGAGKASQGKYFRYPLVGSYPRG